jgi:hypothetical protein
MQLVIGRFRIDWMWGLMSFASRPPEAFSDSALTP